MVISGGLDTNAKIWDLRIKECINTLKCHSKKVSAICSTPDFRYIVTGGEDGQIFTYDLRASKQLFQYEPNSPVLSIDINNNGLISAGCFDRVARIYSITNPSYERKDIKTKMDTMPIVCNKFYNNRYIFTGGSEILKLWEIGTGDKLVMRDGIEGGAKGLLDMFVGEDRVRLVGWSGGVLGGYECLMEEMWFEGKEEKEKEEGKVWMVNNSIYGENDSINSPSANKLPSRNSQNQNSSIAKRSTSVQPFYTKVPQTQQICKKNETFSKELADIHGNINQALQNMKSVSENFNNKKTVLKELEELTGPEHTKFLKVISQRTSLSIEILEYWKKGNTKALITEFQRIDIYVASDILCQILKPSNIQISIEFGIILTEKVKEMIKSKHLTLIKNGLEYLLKIISIFKEEMIGLKNLGHETGVDLAREDKIRKYDRIIEQFVEIYQTNRLKRLAEKNDETSEMSNKIITEFKFIFMKIFGNEAPI